MESLLVSVEVTGSGDDGTELYGVAGGVCGTGLSILSCLKTNSSFGPNN